jgi:transcriptional regulator with XRE-family HTH domain
MAKKTNYNTAQILLGQKIEVYRKAMGMTRSQLGKIINETEQQIGRFEEGAFVPIPKLDRIGKAFNQRIDKQLIRKISKFRDLEQHEKTEYPELCELYEEAFPELEDEF